MKGDSKPSRRELEILDCVYKLEKASAKEVLNSLDDKASYSTIRTLLRNLVDKGHLQIEEKDLKYYYFPTVSRTTASKAALDRVVDTFFKNSPVLAVNSLLAMNQGEVSDEEIEQLEALIKKQKSKRS